MPRHSVGAPFHRFDFTAASFRWAARLQHLNCKSAPIGVGCGEGLFERAAADARSKCVPIRVTDGLCYCF